MAYKGAIETQCFNCTLQETCDDHLPKSVARIHLVSLLQKGILTVECIQFSESPEAKIVYADLRPVWAAEKKKSSKVVLWHLIRFDLKFIFCNEHVKYQISTHYAIHAANIVNDRWYHDILATRHFILLTRCI